jgi:hypothetical protein
MLAEAVPGLTRRRHAVSPFSRCPAIHSDHRRHISPGTVAAARSYSRTRTCGISDARRARSAGALRPEQPVALRVYALRTLLERVVAREQGVNAIDRRRMLDEQCAARYCSSAQCAVALPRRPARDFARLPSMGSRAASCQNFAYPTSPYQGHREAGAALEPREASA